ncbi:MAG: tautomerase family protein [Microbacteriaceae bacterium]
MPIIQVSIAAGRAPERVRDMMRKVAETVAETLDAPLDTIKVLVTEVPLTHWQSGTVTLAEKRAQPSV